MKTKTLIVWQDGRPELERTARQLGDKIAAMDREAVVKKASEVTIPEVLAASSYIFGADDAGDNTVTGVDDL